jgi:hypothetical protein
MTKGDFKLIARVVRRIETDVQRALTAKHFAGGALYKFNREKFLAACLEDFVDD